ncbi:MAG TPA: hypothetical protein VEK56_00405 [Vicinamibacterales bacterium]|nr:hypothetical protein [Vicinamibacterales bacterium]
MKIFKRKPHLPTDLQVLEAIFSRYYDVFSSYKPGSAGADRESKVYVPIDIVAVARDLRTDADLLFGRLYNDLQKRYGYRDEREDSEVPFFALGVGQKDKHVVHFPYLAAVLALLRAEHTKHRTAIWIAIVSLVLSIVSIVVAVVKK